MLPEDLERQRLLEQFISTWPIERLDTMTLKDYTNLKPKESFCYWLESKTEKIGSIWGGSSYKFGIYRRSNQEKQDTRSGYASDGEYGWATKYGSTRDKAFNQVRRVVVQIAKAADAKDFASIDAIDFTPFVKWKIAALYSGQNLIFIYDTKALREIASIKGFDDAYSRSISDIQSFLMGIKPVDLNMFLYSRQLWQLFKSSSDEAKATDGALPIHSRTNQMALPINLILYGPPGTGKTYHTLNYALSIIENKTIGELSKEGRPALQERFDQYRKAGQIEFVTFHQSFSYEDFIEGIKPVLNEKDEKTDKPEESIGYEIRPGIFRTIAENASKAKPFVETETKESIDIAPAILEKANFFKLSLGNVHDPADEEIYRYCIEHNCIALGYGDKINFTGAKDADSIAERFTKAGYDTKEMSDYPLFAVKCFTTWMKRGDVVFIPYGKRHFRAIGIIEGDYEFREHSPIRYKQFRKVRWVMKDIELPVSQIYKKNFSQQTIYLLYKDQLNLDFFQKKQKTQYNSGNYVLIIDEINRGNVSQIFGELITLIEEGKRAGHPEALTLKLPYSQVDFSVPANLYLIGTMNTADRSVEALDTALRRRFSFVEMTPQASLLSNFGQSLLFNLYNRYLGYSWKDPEWLQAEQQLKSFILTPEAYEKHKEEIDNIHNPKALNGLDWTVEDAVSFTQQKGIDFINIEQLLASINSRLEKLVDRDHCIGHAYFMTLPQAIVPLTHLKHIFQNKIIPLLQEYFHGDYGKMGLVIGRAFFEEDRSKSSLNADKFFASFDYEYKQDLFERKVYRLKNIETMEDAEFTKALISVYQS